MHSICVNLIVKKHSTILSRLSYILEFSGKILTIYLKYNYKISNKKKKKYLEKNIRNLFSASKISTFSKEVGK